MLQKLAEFMQPSRRARRPCEACGKPFVCGAALTGCWCFDIKLSPAARAETARALQRLLVPRLHGDERAPKRSAAR